MHRVKRVDERHAARQLETGVEATLAKTVQQGYLEYLASPLATSQAETLSMSLSSMARSRLAAASVALARWLFALARLHRRRGREMKFGGGHFGEHRKTYIVAPHKNSLPRGPCQHRGGR